MLQRTLLLVISLFSIYLHAQQPPTYNKADSLAINLLLKESGSIPPNERMIFFARTFIGTPYVASTLEAGNEEKLRVCIKELDCTTFVETILALKLASESKNKSFNDFKHCLQQVRYRDGKIDGYTSRLHYFSEWIINNQKKGFVRDKTHELSAQKDTVRVDYMSIHADKYKHLQNNAENVEKIKRTEKELSGKEYYHLSKELINRNVDLTPIKDGDIIAFTSKIKGLDVAHVGLAVREKGVLKLLHASSRYKKVLIDPLPIADYVKNGSSLAGVRVLSTER